MTKFIEKAKADWLNQPLSISINGIAIIVAITLWFLKEPPIAVSLSPPFGSLAIFVLLCSIFASLCRLFFSNRLTTLFCISITFAWSCIALFALLEKDQLLKTSAISSLTIKGPLIDLTYWLALLIFLGINARQAMDRIFETWGSIERVDTTTNEKTERGVSPLEFFIVAAVWGSLLSYGQQRAIDAIVFQRAFPAEIVTPHPQ